MFFFCLFLLFLRIKFLKLEKITGKGGIDMTDFLTTIAYAGGGLALGFLIELPLYSAVASTREKYNRVINRIYN
jgi:hypothetical protein